MILYAQRNKEKVAYCRLHQTSLGDLEIAYMKVDDEYRGQGIASQLLNRAKRVAEKDGQWLVAFLDPDGTGLTREQEVAWLKRHGFRHERSYDMTPSSRTFSHFLRRRRIVKRVMVWEAA